MENCHKGFNEMGELAAKRGFFYHTSPYGKPAFKQKKRSIEYGK
jgi:hypothetical protein